MKKIIFTFFIALIALSNHINAQGDVCTTAIDLCGVSTLTGTNVGNGPASDYCAVPACTGADGASASWITFVGDGGTYTLNTNGSDFDTQIAVFTDNGFGCFACVVGNDDGGISTQSAATVTTTSGTTYFVVVDGFGTNEGNWILNVTDGSLADGEGNPLTIACPSAAEPCPPPFICASGLQTYCYDSNLVDEVIIEVCPTNPGETVTLDIVAGAFEGGFDDITILSGAAGSGTAGTVLAGPLDGDQSGTSYTSNPGECIIAVVNSDGSISCVSGSQDQLEYCATVNTVCDGLASPPALTSPVALCDGDGPIDVCFDMVDATQGLNFDLNLDGAPAGVIAATPGVNPNELCIQLPMVANTGCDLETFTITFNAITCDNGDDIPGPTSPSLADDLNAGGGIVITVAPTLMVNTSGDGACGDLTAELVATDGTICASETAVTCAADGDVLNYDFSGDVTFTPPAGCPLPTLSGSLTCGGCPVPMIDIGISDPCECGKAGNIMVNPADLDTDPMAEVLFFTETITIEVPTGSVNVTFDNEVITDMLDVGGNPIAATGFTLTTTNNADGNDEYTFSFYHSPDIGYSYSTDVLIDGVLIDNLEVSNSCTQCSDIANIPTVGEWGLIMLGLLMTITAVVGIRQRREEEVYG